MVRDAFGVTFKNGPQIMVTLGEPFEQFVDRFVDFGFTEGQNALHRVGRSGDPAPDDLLARNEEARNHAGGIRVLSIAGTNRETYVSHETARTYRCAIWKVVSTAMVDSAP